MADSINITNNSETLSHLALMINRYQVESVAFNNHPGSMSDKDVDILMEKTCMRTLRSMNGLPALTPEDALAAIDFIQEEAIHPLQDNLFNRTIEGMLNALRAHVRCATVGIGRES